MTTEKPKKFSFNIEEIQIEWEHFSEISSTHTVSRALDLKDYPSNKWKVISADMQTNGVGTHNRKWLSDKVKNLNLTMNFSKIKPDLFYGYPLNQNEEIVDLKYIQVPAMAAYFLIEEILKENNITNKTIGLKWPNDLLVNGKKICGCLTHGKFINKDKSLLQLTCSIGMNLNYDKEYLNQVNQAATSLFIETGIIFEPLDIIKKILPIIVNLFKKYEKNKEMFHKDFMEKLLFLNDKVTVFDDKTEKYYTGKIEAINDFGFLFLKNEDDGKVYEIRAGVLRKIEN